MKHTWFIQMFRNWLAMLVKNERAKQQLLRKNPELYARLYSPKASEF